MADPSIITGAFTLGGVALGFTGNVIMRRIEERRRKSVVVGSILQEMSTLADIFQSPFRHGILTSRRPAESPMWDTYWPDLVNLLTPDLVGALHYHYRQLDMVSWHYDVLAKGKIALRDIPQVESILLGWSYRSERMRELYDEWCRRTAPPWKRSKYPKLGSAAEIWDKADRLSSSWERVRALVDDLRAFSSARLSAEGRLIDAIPHVTGFVEQKDGTVISLASMVADGADGFVVGPGKPNEVDEAMDRKKSVGQEEAEHKD